MARSRRDPKLKTSDHSTDQRDVEPPPARPPRVRPVFLIALALAVVALVVQRTWFPPERAPWRGTTGQAHEIVLGWEDGDVWFVDAEVDVTCADGSRRSFMWSPYEGGPTMRFAHRGDDLRTDEVWDYRVPDGNVHRMVARLRGRVGEESARGTLRATLRLTGGSYGRTTCDTGEVEWSAAP